MRSRLILILLIIFSLRCTKIENLSVDTSLKSFTVLSHSPQTILLGEVTISADTVYVPIEYGRYEFPLTLEVEADASGGAYIYGVGKDTPIIFETIDDEPLRFVVSAESGASKNYYLALQEVPLDDSCELLDQVSFGEVEHLLSESLVAAGDLSKMIVAVGAEYPLTLTPTFTTAQSSAITSFRKLGEDEWSQFENGAMPLTFEDDASRYEIEIISQSGKSERWSVGLSVVSYSPIEASTQINYRELSAACEQEGVAIHSYDIDFETGEIVMLLDTEDDVAIEFPLCVSLDIPTNEWLSLVGVSESQLYTFEDWDTQYSFALLYPDKLQATSWSISIAPYKASEQSVVVESAAVDSFSCGTYTFILTYSHLTASTLRAEPEVYAQSRQIILYYSSYYEPYLSSSSISSWWAEYTLNLELSNGEQISQPLRWEAVANSSSKITQTEIRAALAATLLFEVEQTDGTFEQWSVILMDEDTTASTECELLSFEIIDKSPSYLEFSDPIYTLDDANSTIYLNIGSHYSFPLSVDLSYSISPYASITPFALLFEDEESEQLLTVTAQDGVSQREYTIKLVVPQEAVAPTISSISFGDLAAGASLTGDVSIDVDNCRVTIGLEATDAHFPLELPISAVEVADGGTFDMPASASLTFNSAQSTAVVWVSSADGTARQMWNFSLFYYQQIAGADMDAWEWDASPVTSSLPWSTPNMSGIASVTNTTPVDGRYATADDYAAQMQTGTSWGQLAAGSIFTGWFDKNNSTAYGLSDPVRLTYFGTPFTPDATIVGITADVSYAAATDAVDWGSLTVILIAEDPTASFEFHGNKPNDSDDPTAGGAPHPNNTAVEVASSRMIFGNGTATQTTYGDEISMNVEAGEWVEVYIPITTDEPFTHISVAAASSAYGDYFIGEVGSVMRIDNVKVIYK